jgi:hypothetical protein
VRGLPCAGAHGLNAPYGSAGHHAPGYGPVPGGFGAPGPAGPAPYPPKKKGMNGCLLAFLIFLGLGLVTTIGVGIWVWREFGTMIGGVQEMADLTLEAQSAPGADEVRKSGCDEAYAVDTRRLETTMNKLEAEIAKREGRKPRPMEIDAVGDRIVTCVVKSGKMPSCADVAKTYRESAKPTANFLVMVGRNLGDKDVSCAERFAPDGKSLGPADAVDFSSPQ